LLNDGSQNFKWISDEDNKRASNISRRKEEQGMKISQERRTRARIKKLEEGIREHKIDNLFCKTETFCFKIC